MIGYVVFALGLVALVVVTMSVRVIKQYEPVVLFELGRVKDGARGPGLIFFVPFVDRVHRVSLRIITMPIQSQGDHHQGQCQHRCLRCRLLRVEDPIRSLIAIENVESAINQIAQTTLRAVLGRHTLDETLSDTDTINLNLQEIQDVQTEEWRIKVTAAELRDIQLPDSMQRAMARQAEAEAEAEREKRAKMIAAQGEALVAEELAHASDAMMAHLLALQLRNFQTLVELGVDKNSTVVFPAPLMSTIGRARSLPQPRDPGSRRACRHADPVGSHQPRGGSVIVRPHEQPLLTGHRPESCFGGRSRPMANPRLEINQR